MTLWMQSLSVAFGAACGAMIRWQLSVALNARWPLMPLGTLLANLIGGYIVGVALAYFATRPEWSPHWKLMLTTGFCGGLTTFSTFSAEVLSLLTQQRFGAAALTATVHLIGSLAATALGFATVRCLPSIPS